jgi:polysaccharide export outer membrane protein
MTSIRHYRGSKVCCAEWFLAAILLLSTVGASRAEYRLDVDDVIEIAVAGVPDLKQRVTVQIDGTISFPLIGALAVGGLTIPELRSKVQAALATKVFRQRSPDGRENVFVIEPDQVTAAIVEFRPIFVNGDVSKPGQLPYRPLMTVRHAVALAGGYELMRFRITSNPFLESAELRGEYDARWTEFVKEQAHIWRLKSELGNTVDFDQKVLTARPCRARRSPKS